MVMGWNRGKISTLDLGGGFMAIVEPQMDHWIQWKVVLVTAGDLEVTLAGGRTPAKAGLRLGESRAMIAARGIILEIERRLDGAG